jgi:hypothetical protein
MVTRKPSASDIPPRPRINRSRKKNPPSGRGLVSDSPTITLEELLVGFQRSLSRATRSSIEAARADLQIGMGQRSLYVIDSIGVTVNPKLLAARDKHGSVQAIAVDLSSPSVSGEVATLQFQVQSRPIESINSEQLIAADLDPLGLKSPCYHLRITLIGDSAQNDSANAKAVAGAKGTDSPDTGKQARDTRTTEPPVVLAPLRGKDVVLHIVGSDSLRQEKFTLTTNEIGQFDIVIDALNNRLSTGDHSETFQNLDLHGYDDDFFVYAFYRGDRPLVSNVQKFSVKRLPE